MSDIDDTDFLNLATPPAMDEDEQPGSLPHPRFDPSQVSVPMANRVYIPPSLAGRNPLVDDQLLEEAARPAQTPPVRRPGVPLIATTDYPGRLVDARTVVLSANNTQEVVGYRGGAPSPGLTITFLQYLDANPTAVVELLAEGFEASTQLGFVLPTANAAPITLPISKAMLRLNNIGTGQTVRVGVLIVATDREP